MELQGPSFQHLLVYISDLILIHQSFGLAGHVARELQRLVYNIGLGILTNDLVSHVLVVNRHLVEPVRVQGFVDTDDWVQLTFSAA